jgi:threonine-phosphate decarboxylase
VQQHGGLRTDELRALGLDPAAVLDFSASVNPLGPSPRVREALARLDLARYPDPACLELTEALARRHGVGPDQVLCGNGASELIHLAVRVFVHGGQRAVAFTPTFGEFERACALVGASVFPWRANPERGFRWNLRNKADVLRRVTPPLLYLCNPNNPTGVYLDEASVRSVTEGLTGGPMLLDEAYANFVDEPWDATPLTRRGRVILLRSMTKDYGLAGLRLGYVVAHPDAIAAMRRLQPEWSVSAAAQAAGLAALEDGEHLARSLALIREAKAELIEVLERADFRAHVGAANFLLVHAGDASRWRTALLELGIAVRDCTSFGLPEWLRVAVRTPDENARLVDALRAVRAIERHEVAG